MIKHIANILTGFRIFGSILLLFFSPFSLAFYTTYLICGLSDMTDGTVARLTHSTSKLGSQLDTAADLVFVVASLIRLLPSIRIPGWLWIWGGLIALIKISSIIWWYASKNLFLSLHSTMNKITGLLLFFVPLTTSIMDVRYSLIVVCSFATLSAIHEGICVIANSRSR